MEVVCVYVCVCDGGRGSHTCVTCRRETCFSFSNRCGFHNRAGGMLFWQQCILLGMERGEMGSRKKTLKASKCLYIIMYINSDWFFFVVVVQKNKHSSLSCCCAQTCFS